MLTNSNMFFGALWALADTVVILGGGFRLYTSFSRRLDRIEYQLYENGGGSMKDQMNELVKDVLVIKTVMEMDDNK